MQRDVTRITAPQARMLARRLERRAAALRGEIALGLHSTSIEIPPRDRVTADVEAAVTIAGAERDAGELREIEEALARLDAGTYGTCTECGAPLPLRRLDALPHARRCVHCESACEHRPAPHTL